MQIHIVTRGMLCMVFIALFMNSCHMIEHYTQSSMKQLELNEKKFTTKDGVEIAYADNELVNADNTIFFIHGYGVDRFNFFSLAKKFKKEGYRLILVDVPGFGKSSKDLNKSYKSTTQAARLAELIESLDLQKVHIVGTSMGGGIAAFLNPMIQERVKSNTLIAPYGMPLSTDALPGVLGYFIETGKIAFLVDDPYDRKRTNKLLYYASNTPSFLVPFFIKSEIKQRFYNDREIIAKTGKDFLYDFNELKRFANENKEMSLKLQEAGVDINTLEISQEKSQEKLLELMAQISSKKLQKVDELGVSFESIVPALEKIQNPVLVIWGGKDNIIHPSTMEKMKPYIKEVKYVYYPGGSHSISMMRAKRIAKEMRNYILDTGK